MQFSTGRNELNPYIAVIIGLLSLAVYVAASSITLPKAFTNEEAILRRTEPSPLGTTELSRLRTTDNLPKADNFMREDVNPEPQNLYNRPTLSTLNPINNTGQGQFGGNETTLEPSLEPSPKEPTFESTPDNQVPETSLNLYSDPEFSKSLTPYPATTTAVTSAGLSLASASTGSMGSSVVWTLISILIGVVVFFGLLAVLARLGGIDISAAFQRGLSNERSLYDVTISQNNTSADPVSPVPYKSPEPSEVFQVGNGNLTYLEARGACQAQGAKLANYSQIEDAYKNGGEWCSYGWSEGQLALFPTQKSTYDRLQKGCTGDQNSCGRPGINGGYIANPNVRFAANCFGVKPRPTKEERRETQSNIITPEDSEANRIAQLYKKADKQFKIRPFAPGEWFEEDEEASQMKISKRSIAANDDIFAQYDSSLDSSKTILEKEVSSE